MKNPDPTPSPAGTSLKLWYLTRRLTGQLSATGDEAAQKPGPPPKLPNSPLHRALIPFLKPWDCGLLAITNTGPARPTGRKTKLSSSQVQTITLHEALQFSVKILLLRAREEGQGTSRRVCPFLLTFQRQSQDHTGMLMLIYFFKVNKTAEKERSQNF